MSSNKRQWRSNKKSWSPNAKCMHIKAMARFQVWAKDHSSGLQLHNLDIKSFCFIFPIKENNFAGFRENRQMNEWNKHSVKAVVSRTFTFWSVSLTKHMTGDGQMKMMMRMMMMMMMDYLSWGRVGQSPNSSCCRSYTGCHSDSLVAPTQAVQNTCSCRSQMLARTETQSELRTKETENRFRCCCFLLF